MVAESNFYHEDPPLANEANGPPDPRDPRSRLRAYPARIELPPLSPLARLLLLFPNRVYEAQVTRQICDNVDLGTDLVGRPLTQEETDAFVAQAALLVRGPRQGAMLGLLAANLLSFRGLARFLLRPRALDWAALNPRAFPFVKVGVTSGFGIFAGAVFGNVWAAANASRNLLADDRLRTFREHRKAQDQDAILRRVRERAVRRKGGLAGDPARVPPAREIDDSSPQAGYDVAAATPYASTTEVAPTLVDDGGAAPARPYYARDGYAQYAENQAPARGDGGADFFDADAPTSADPDSPRYEHATATTNAGGSAWERLRASAQGGSEARAEGGRGGEDVRGFVGGKGADAFGGGRTREEAQREFDELLERERQLGSGGDRDRPRWAN